MHDAISKSAAAFFFNKSNGNAFMCFSDSEAASKCPEQVGGCMALCSWDEGSS